MPCPPLQLFSVTVCVWWDGRDEWVSDIWVYICIAAMQARTEALKRLDVALWDPAAADCVCACVRMLVVD
jgi:hypothetical protein